VPYQAFRTADGHVVIAVFGDGFWPPLCRALGLEELVERYPDNASRHAHREEVVARLQGRLEERTTDEWVAALRAAGVPGGPVNTVDRVLSDPQVRHRGMVASDGERELLGNPIKTGAPDVFRPAPALGQHDAELLPR
jgi:crotonobetainyl-CoA:carnitine CoA-transferase CaiB-like acyl-CoA transferase